MWRNTRLSAAQPRTRTVHHSIDELDPRQWNALGGDRNPFLRHEFLAALEHTQCIGPGTGWDPTYITLSDPSGLAAAAPAFIKSHSYGEFVFDFAWAQSVFSRVGRRSTIPKLAVAIPFTPATGPRLPGVRPGSRPEPGRRNQRSCCLKEIETFASSHSLSSVHALFLDEPARAVCADAGWLIRRDCQFHWTNREYPSFEAYLQTFTAEKRKKARRERRRVAEAGIHFETLMGSDLDERTLDTVYAFHSDTFLRHGHETYLTREFFTRIARNLGDSFMVKLALHGKTPVAAAIFFWCQDALYGRYWGAAADYNSLHFETCYHQGIEFCIERGIAEALTRAPRANTRSVAASSPPSPGRRITLPTASFATPSRNTSSARARRWTPMLKRSRDTYRSGTDAPAQMISAAT